jgi:NodT family efflux transporter outer membrane factor (OMF) lipoprotein
VSGLRRIVVAAVIALLAACSMAPEYERPSVPMAENWHATATLTAAALPVNADWWRRFSSGEFDRLMAEALAANQDLAAALARIRQARAVARIAGSPLLPALDVSGSGARDSSGSRGDWDSRTSYDALLTASYEIDLWGRNAAGLQAAEADVTASVFDRDALALVVQGDVAASYFEAVALKERLAIARENLAAARRILELVEVRFRQGAASALDVAQQRAAVATFESQLPQLAQQLQAAQTSLAVLLGRAPGDTAVELDSLGALTLPAIAAGQPATLLERRPDIRRSEAELQAANADIGAARAAFYPSITLSAAAGIEGVASGGASALASLVAGLVQPIFTAGALEGELERTKARREELVAGYRQTVLTAFKEVEDALTTVGTSAARTASLRRAVAEASEAFRLAQLSYGAGAVDFLTVLDAQRTLLDSRDSLVQAELERFTTAAGLFKALGGGWAEGGSSES